MQGTLSERFELYPKTNPDDSHWELVWSPGVPKCPGSWSKDKKSNKKEAENPFYQLNQNIVCYKILLQLDILKLNRWCRGRVTLHDQDRVILTMGVIPIN